VPFSEIRRAGRYATACLTATIRSQGSSPSQRFDPNTPSRLCFAPHPLVGFRPSELLPPEPAVTPYDARCSLAIGHTPSSLSSGRGNTTRRSSTRAQALTSELCSGLASDTPHDRGLPQEAAALLAFVLSEVCQSVDRPASGYAPHALEPGKTPRLPTNTLSGPCTSGYGANESGSCSRESRINLLEVFEPFTNNPTARLRRGA
jgi:hypothetical protein